MAEKHSRESDGDEFEGARIEVDLDATDEEDGGVTIVIPTE